MKDFFEDIVDDLCFFFRVLPKMIIVVVIAETIVLCPLFLLKWLFCD